MTLDYQEKLKIFHEEFVKYAWKYIDFQKRLAADQVVENVVAPSQIRYDYIKELLIVGSIADWALEFYSSFFNPFKIDLSSSIREIFPGDESKVKKTLSMAIQKIAIHIESHLSELNDNNDISKLATKAVTKLIYYLDKTKVTQCTEANIVTGVLEQKSWFTRDVFVPRNLENLSQSEHYYFKNKNGLESSSISTEIDSSEESSSTLIEQKQRIIYEESESILKFIDIGKPKFKTNIPELQSDWDQDQINYRKRSFSQSEEVLSDNKNSKPSHIIFNNVEKIDNFIGMKDELNNLNQYFNDNGGRIQVIAGSPGVGKTQLALKYANDYQADYEYRVRWFDASTSESLERSFREFAQALFAKDRFFNAIGEDINEVKKLVLKKLDTVGKTLLVFDNVLKQEDLENYISYSNPRKFDIIITTNSQEKWTKDNLRVIGLQRLTLQAANILIEEFITGEGFLAISKDDVKQLEELCASMTPTQRKQKQIKYYSKKFKNPKDSTQASQTNLMDLSEDEMDLAVQIQEKQQNLKKTKNFYQTYHQNSQDSYQNSALSSYSESESNKEQYISTVFFNDNSYTNHIVKQIEITLNFFKQLHPDYYKILKLCSYLDANSIPIQLILLFNSNQENNFLKMNYTLYIVLLQKFGFLLVSDNILYVDMNPIFHEIINHLEKQSSQSSDIFKQIIDLARGIGSLFTLNYSTEAEYIKNKSNFLHAKSLIHHAKQFKENNEFSYDLVYLKLAVAVYYDFTGNHNKAVKILSSLNEVIKNLINEKGDLKDFISELAKKSPKLPDLYAQIYYHLGKAGLSFYLKKIEDRNNFNNNLNKDFLDNIMTAAYIQEQIKPNSRPSKPQINVNHILRAIHRLHALEDCNKSINKEYENEFALRSCFSSNVEVLIIQKLQGVPGTTELLKILSEDLLSKYGDIINNIKSENLLQRGQRKDISDEEGNTDTDESIQSTEIFNALIGQVDPLLEKIQTIEIYLGEESINNNYPGFYDYIRNALLNNGFSKSAKQVISELNKLFEGLQSVTVYLYNSQERTASEVAEAVNFRDTIVWQIKYLLEFTASGQKFIGFSGRAPGIGPDGDDYGGGYGGGYDQENNHDEASQYQKDDIAQIYDCYNSSSEHTPPSTINGDLGSRNSSGSLSSFEGEQ